MSRLNVANFRHPDGTADNLNLDSSGRVGIGTASPSVPLQVNGTGQIARFESSSSSAVVRLANTETNPCEFVYTSDLAINVGGSERARVDSSGNLRFNSGFGSVATAYGVRAWVNFNGTGTVAIRDDRNVSSITDNSTGNYTVNFTNSMPDTNFCVCGSVVGNSTGPYHCFVAGGGSANTTSSCRFDIVNGNSNIYDLEVISIAVIR